MSTQVKNKFPSAHLVSKEEILEALADLAEGRTSPALKLLLLVGLPEEVLARQPYLARTFEK